MANGIGSLVVSSRFFNSLPQDLQKLLKRTGKETGEKLIAATRTDNAESLEVLRQRGMQFVMDTEDLDSKEVKELNRRAGETLMEEGYIPQATIQKVNKWLDEYHAAKSEEVQEPSKNAGDSLMENGYVPQSTTEQISKSKEMIDVSG
jgi:hypothetical protein